MLQVDTSLHSGNSGGPIIDIRGKVIGIATGVAMGWAVGPVPMSTPLSDIGMILPITKAVSFIQDLKPGRNEYQVQIKTFTNTIEKTYEDRSAQRAKLAPLLAKLKQESISPEEKRKVLEQTLKNEPGNGEILSGSAFLCAMGNDWESALGYARNFLGFKGRENGAQLGVGLLEAEILHNAGQTEEAKAGLEDYYRRIKDSWYLAISEYLLGKQTEQSLSAKAGESPENLVTWHTALGFWAEGSGEKNEAIKHYREALGTYMDPMIEYDFVRERIKRLRQNSE